MKPFVTILLFFSLSTCYSQNSPDELQEKINRKVEYYIESNKYLYIESNYRKSEFQDTVRIDFGKRETIQIKIRGYNTTNSGTLYLLDETNAPIDTLKDDCWATQFLTYKIYNENWSHAKLVLSSCHMASIIILIK